MTEIIKITEEKEPEPEIEVKGSALTPSELLKIKKEMARAGLVETTFSEKKSFPLEKNKPYSGPWYFKAILEAIPKIGRAHV